MRRIAIINQKGGVGKTTTTVNLGAALAIQGRRVVLVDMDAQANLSMALGIEAASGEPTSYSVLMGDHVFAACIRATKIPGLSIVPSNIDLSGAELELASAMGREYLLRDALTEWNDAHVKQHGTRACDYVLFDCPPSLGLLSINALAAAGEVLITLQTEFLALQGMSKLLEIVTLLKKRLNPDLVVTGIVPSLYDSRLRLAREVLAEIRTYFKEQVVPHPIRANVKLAEAPSFGQTIFEYAPDSNGADDYMKLAFELVSRETRDKTRAALPPFDPTARLPIELTNEVVAPKRVPPPPRRKVPTVPLPAAPPTARVEVAQTVPVVRTPSAPQSTADPAMSASTTPWTPAQNERSAAPSRRSEIEPRPAAASKPIATKAALVKNDSQPTVKHARVVGNAPAASKKPAEPPKPIAKSPPTRKASSKSVEITPAPPAAQSSKKGRETSPIASHKAPPAREIARAQPPSVAKTNGKQTGPDTKNAVAKRSTKMRDALSDKPAPYHSTTARTPTKFTHTLHDEDIPALPPDAFEILSTPLDP
ncbi:MAG: AAA family ATPase [Planctomycetota bacterium]|nr:AAA family ATPase [Planctomycetota bacterium]